MANSVKSRGYRIIIVPLDGGESKTVSLSKNHLHFLIVSLLIVLITLLLSILLWGYFVSLHIQNTALRNEIKLASEQATRMTVIEKNIFEIDKYLNYIRFAMNLTGDSLPPALDEFMVNDSLKNHYELTSDSLNFENIPNILPCNGLVTQDYSIPDKHLGIDYAASIGTVIRSTADGVVSVVRYDEYLGNIVSVNHENGFTTQYSHCNEITVATGVSVKRGDIIATVGNTGKSSTGPHCHYEIFRNGKPEDPRIYILKGLE